MKENANESNVEGVESSQIIVVIYNISRNLTRKHLQEIFNAYGNVKGVYIPKDDETKLLKNYAFVEYEKQQEADKASLYLGGGQIDGLVVRTEILNPNHYNLKKKQESRSRSRSRDKEIAPKTNDSRKGSKNPPYTRDKGNDSQRRRKYHRRHSSPCSHSKSRDK